MKKDIEELLKQLQHVKRPAQKRADTKQKLFARIQSTKRRQTLQYRGVLVLATVLALFLGVLLWTQGDMKWQRQASQRKEDDKTIQAIYTNQNNHTQYFMARDSILYPGNRKIASDEEMYTFVNWLIENAKPIEEEREVQLDYSEIDIVVRYTNGQLRHFKFGELYDTYERVLVDWDTKQTYIIPTLTEKQRAQLQKLKSSKSFYLPMFMMPLLIASAIVEKKIRKKYKELSRVKLYNSWIGNGIFMCIGILVLSPAFLSIYFHMSIHIIVPFLLYIAYVIGDWLLYRKGGRTAAQRALAYWSYFYILVTCFIFYFFM